MGRDDPPRLVGQPAPAPYEEPAPAAAADVDEQANSVFVGGVPNTITLALLTELLAQFGPVQDVRMLKTPQGDFKGAAFCDYTSAASARYAVAALDGVALGGRRLRVNPAKRGAPGAAAPPPLSPPGPPPAASRDGHAMDRVAEMARRMERDQDRRDDGDRDRRRDDRDRYDRDRYDRDARPRSLDDMYDERRRDERRRDDRYDRDRYRRY